MTRRTPTGADRDPLCEEALRRNRELSAENIRLREALKRRGKRRVEQRNADLERELRGLRARFVVLPWKGYVS